MSNFKEIWTVLDLNKFVSNLFDQEMPPVYVKGELSNFTIASSGHWYFTLKDDYASIRVVLFRGFSSLVNFSPKNGDQVQVYAKLSLYSPRGDFQLQATEMKISGAGNLHEKFLIIKERLLSEGLFDSTRKKKITQIPNAVGVITSLEAAALKDVISVFKRRAPFVRLIIYPTMVQGSEVSYKIINQLEIANRRLEVDTLLLVRGGGSLEDLWGFNNEELARAISNSSIPVITGIGHDIDFTIADFVADLRAPTPTAAAELACLSKEDIKNKLYWYWNSIRKSQSNIIQTSEQSLDRLSFRVLSPSNIIDRKKDMVFYLFRLLTSLIKEPCLHFSQKISLIKKSLSYNKPDTFQRLNFIKLIHSRLNSAIASKISNKNNTLISMNARLNSLDPENILFRGYSLVSDSNGNLIKSSSHLLEGQRLEIKFSDGTVIVLVDSKKS